MWGGERRKFVAEILERKREALIEADGIGEGVWQIAEELGHLRGGFHVALRVDLQASTGRIERRVLTQAGEHIGNNAMFGDRVVHAAGGEQGQAMGRGEITEKVVFPLLTADAVALELDEETGAGGIRIVAENRREFFERSAGRGGALGTPGATNGTFGITRECNKSGVETGEFFPRGETRAFAIAGIRRVGRVFVALRVSAGTAASRGVI